MFTFGGEITSNRHSQPHHPTKNSALHGNTASQMSEMETDPLPSQQPEVGQMEPGSNNLTTTANSETADRSGLLRYFTVVDKKRKRNHQQKSTKLNMHTVVTTKNRFDPLTTIAESIQKPKPPPIYIRERSTNSLAHSLKGIIKQEYYLVDLKRGALYETKLQVSDETDYTVVTKWLDKAGKQYYTFQLKSQKGLRVVLKGIDPQVNPEEIKQYLENLNYKVQWVHNILNKYKIPQPMFKVELAPESSIAPKGKCHPIYELRYVLNRKISVEEPYKRSGPVQCQNCQEFGHTKTYCKLSKVCVGCGGNHNNTDCPNDKTNALLKKCSNCGENHTANYRGCIVFREVKKHTKPLKSYNSITPNLPTPTQTNIFTSTNNRQTSYVPEQQNSSYSTYANAVKQPPEQYQIIDAMQKQIMMILNTIQQLTSSIQQMQELQRQQTEIITKLVKP
jgi:hypothetical protein